MTNPKIGLIENQVLKSRKEHGENIITPPKKKSVFKLFLEKFEDPIIKILIFTALLSLIIAYVHGDYTETIGIIVAIFLSTSIGFWFEYDAQRKFDILNIINDKAPVRVLRNGAVHIIEKKDVVVGDIILLEAGEEIPADGKLLESMALGINESSLTGELFVYKTTNPKLFDKEATYHSSQLLRGTTIIEGSGVMAVEKVGDATELGDVAKASSVENKEKTPLTKQLDKLAGVISIIGSVLSFLVFFILLIKYININSEIIGEIPMTTLKISLFSLFIIAMKGVISIIDDTIKAIFKTKKSIPNLDLKWWSLISILFFTSSMSFLFYQGVDILSLNSWINIDTIYVILNYFMIAVSLIVMAVPEGLPMSVTLSLALNMRRMLKSNNLVRKMHACETMGAINVICTDKTGTLTENQMNVSDINIIDGISDDLLYEGIAINSTSHLEIKDGKISTIGNPTESALLLWLKTKNIDYKTLREDEKIIDQKAFTSERKSMLTLVNSKTLDKKVIYIKGAPEVILSKCNLSDNEMKSYTDMLLGYQHQAKRTLAMGYAIVEGDNCDEIYDDTIFNLLAIVAIDDPIRKEVPFAIAECMSAGVEVKIVTGDTSATAIEIARRIGLWDDKKDSLTKNHITGSDFALLTDKQLDDIVMNLKIISRAKPIDKKRLVQSLQRLKMVVAVTGDGTNDAPALNFADVGLSMGSGTSVAKDASDITIIDDSFKSISTAVMWGRSLYRNIQRFLLFQLTINIVALGIFIIAVALGSEPPLTITQILWVNIIMDTLAAAGLSSLPPVEEVMNEKPRKENEFIISKKMRRNIFGMGAFLVSILIILLYYVDTNYENQIKGHTIFFTTFVMMQFWNMFNAKVFESGFTSAFKNIKKSRAFMYVSMLIFLGQFLIVSYGGKVFRVVSLTFSEWIVIFFSTSLLLIFGELGRYIKRRHKKD
ncbi:MAG: cation-translocating P-type ATPase [Bacteroidetes bacterium]|nr:cation-translocating P-type ATPase [Bacteroidota bacterium]